MTQWNGMTCESVSHKCKYFNTTYDLACWYQYWTEMNWTVSCVSTRDSAELKVYLLSQRIYERGFSPGWERALRLQTHIRPFWISSIQYVFNYLPAYCFKRKKVVRGPFSQYTPTLKLSVLDLPDFFGSRDGERSSLKTDVKISPCILPNAPGISEIRYLPKSSSYRSWRKTLELL